MHKGVSVEDKKALKVFPIRISGVEGCIPNALAARKRRQNVNLVYAKVDRVIQRKETWPRKIAQHGNADVI